MYKLYIIVNLKSDSVYFGMTKQSLIKRLSQHFDSIKTKRKSKLIDAIKKYGKENFEIRLLASFEEKDLCCFAEKLIIDFCRNAGVHLYNIAEGGYGGFVVQDIDAWIEKLSLARKGRKPSLGLKHTDNTKLKCKEASNRYWKNKDTFTKKQKQIVEYGEEHGYKKAMEVFGISQTQYYRLKKKYNISEKD